MRDLTNKWAKKLRRYSNWWKEFLKIKKCRGIGKVDLADYIFESRLLTKVGGNNCINQQNTPISFWNNVRLKIKFRISGIEKKNGKREFVLIADELLIQIRQDNAKIPALFLSPQTNLPLAFDYRREGWTTLQRIRKIVG